MILRLLGRLCGDHIEIAVARDTRITFRGPGGGFTTAAEVHLRRSGGDWVVSAVGELDRPDRELQRVPALSEAPGSPVPASRALEALLRYGIASVSGRTAVWLAFIPPRVTAVYEATPETITLAAFRRAVLGAGAASCDLQAG